MPSLICLAYEILILFPNYLTHVIRSFSTLGICFSQPPFGLSLAHTLIYVLMSFDTFQLICANQVINPIILLYMLYIAPRVYL